MILNRILIVSLPIPRVPRTNERLVVSSGGEEEGGSSSSRASVFLLERRRRRKLLEEGAAGRRRGLGVDAFSRREFELNSGEFLKILSDLFRSRRT